MKAGEAATLARDGAGFVADASVSVAWVIPSQATAATDRLLDEVSAGTSFAVPVLWAFEVANTLLVLQRRKRLEPKECARARQELGLLCATVDDPGPGSALGSISDLAERRGLSVYDATYLELAIRLALPLASRDAALNKAAILSGVRTLAGD
jgi:predicted nucleic acid-binding protein